MFRNVSQNYLLPPLLRDQGQDDEHLVPWISPFLFLNIGMTKGSNALGIKYFPLTSNLPTYPQLIYTCYIFFYLKRMKSSDWTEAASFHGGTTMSLLFCSPKMFIVHCDHMARKKRALEIAPQLPKSVLLVFTYSFYISPNPWKSRLWNKTAPPHTHPYTVIIELPQKARIQSGLV